MMTISWPRTPISQRCPQGKSGSVTGESVENFAGGRSSLASSRSSGKAGSSAPSAIAPLTSATRRYGSSVRRERVTILPTAARSRSRATAIDCSRARASMVCCAQAAPATTSNTKATAITRSPQASRPAARLA